MDHFYFIRKLFMKRKKPEPNYLIDFSIQDIPTGAIVFYTQHLNQKYNFKSKLEWDIVYVGGYPRGALYTMDDPVDSNLWSYFYNKTCKDVEREIIEVYKKLFTGGIK